MSCVNKNLLISIQVQVFGSFENLLSVGFPIVYGKTILHEHQFLAILVPGTNFWTGQVVGGASRLDTVNFWLVFLNIKAILGISCRRKKLLLILFLSNFSFTLQQKLWKMGIICSVDITQENNFMEILTSDIQIH